MKNTELYDELKKSFTKENLTQITGKLLDLYRNKLFKEIFEIYKTVYSQATSADVINNPGKAFFSLIKLYHPDRLNLYLQNIEEYFLLRNTKKLMEMSELIRTPYTVQTVPEEKIETDDETDIPESSWGYSEDDFDEYGSSSEFHDEISEYSEESSEDNIFQSGTSSAEDARDFISVLKLVEIGLADVDVSETLLSALEGSLDLSGYDMDDLYGINHCVNITSLNLSGNNLYSVEELSGLFRLKELYISNNHISDLTPLLHLEDLTEIDLSFNDIEDILPLTKMHNLLFVNLIGNKCQPELVKTLQKSGISVLV